MRPVRDGDRYQDATGSPRSEHGATVDGELFALALRHDPSCPVYNPHLRQLLHVGYKIAAEMGPRFLHALESGRDTIAQQVTTNLFDRHIRPLFLDD